MDFFLLLLVTFWENLSFVRLYFIFHQYLGVGVGGKGVSSDYYCFLVEKFCDEELH